MASRLSNDEFVKRSKNIHNNFYDYLDEYKNAHTKVKINCPKHGIFQQKPYSHLNGIGCPKCGFDKSADKNRKNISDFINISNDVHNNKYNYNYLDYKNNKTPVKIECPIHGFFNQLPQHHINGSGCPNCAPKKDIKSNDNFIEQANNIHKNKYTYETYKGAHILLGINCPKHGRFEQTPNSHLKGRGCPKCQYKNSSILEKIWLDQIGIKEEYRDFRIKIEGVIYKFDAFTPYDNTIYEFYGDFWHGNPEKYKDGDYNLKNNMLFSDLYKKTIDREIFLLSKGYKIISIWENDFIKKNKQILNQKIKYKN